MIRLFGNLDKNYSWKFRPESSLMERVEEMEAKILSSIDDIKNEMNGIKTEQNEMKK